MSRALNLLGADFRGPLLPPRPDNPTGFWELASLGPVHDLVLEQLSRLFDDGDVTDPWWSDARLASLRSRIRAILEQTFDGATLWGVKDPRMCLLTDLWLDLLSEMGCDATPVIVLRNPLEVAASLSLRDGLPIPSGQELWLRHLLAVERSTRGLDRFFVPYDELIVDWRGVLRPLLDSTRIDFSVPIEDAEANINSFLDPTLRHHITPNDPTSDDGVDVSWIERARRSLWSLATAVEPNRSREILEDLDRITMEIAETDRHWYPELPIGSARLRRDVDQALGYLRSVTQLASLRSTHESVVTELAAARAAKAKIEKRTEDTESALRSELQHARDDLIRTTERTRLDAMELDATRMSLSELSEERITGRERLRSAIEEADRLCALTQRAEAEARTAQSSQSLLLGALAEHHAREDATARKQHALIAWLQEGLSSRTREAQEKSLRLETLERELSAVRNDLAAHEQAYRNVISAFSWRVTRPLRWTRAAFRGLRSTPLNPVSRSHDPSPWEELLPGRVFQQLFRPPVESLEAIGLRFFTYHRENDTRVRIRLSESQRLRPSRVIHEEVLEGWAIQDGLVSTFDLDHKVTDASKKWLLLEIESLDGTPGRTVTIALAPSNYDRRNLAGLPPGDNRGLVLEFNPVTNRQLQRGFAFITGCPGDSARYRCQHIAESLRFEGHTVDVLPPHVFPWKLLLSCYQVVVVHRVAYTETFERFVKEASNRGVHVIFDTDDLVFDPSIVPRIDAVQHMNKRERELFEDGVLRYRKSLSLCGSATTSTEQLQSELQSSFPAIRAAVIRNRASDEMVHGSDKSLASERDHSGFVRIAYMSGSRTHRRDFDECVPALQQILDVHPQVQIVLVGHIDLPPQLREFEWRVERHPFVDWRRLPSIYRGIDINLAPLERMSPFTDAKSELKFIEASLLAVPTVASPVGGYRKAIEHGRTGFLCDETEDWTSTLTALVRDPTLRNQIGTAARNQVIDAWTTRGAAKTTTATFRKLLGDPSANRRLRVAFVLRAPIAHTGGGYMKIFQIAHFLAHQGHQVDLYVEPIAHLDGYTEHEVRAFCARHFGESPARIHCGHEDILPSDVAIATNWPTAYVVDQLVNTRLKAYFVQDYEPSFYDETDPLYSLAEGTYGLPLRIISIGSYLAETLGRRNRLTYGSVDFSLGAHFFEERSYVEDRLRRVRSDSSISLLFFARPELPRRCFELGVESIARVHEKCPDLQIALYGMAETRVLPFSYRNLGELEPQELAQVMRRSDIHLSFSKTNPTTVMFEAMASGCAVIELDEPGTQALVETDVSCLVVEEDPEAVAEAVIGLSGDPSRRLALARGGLEASAHLTVENMCRQFETQLLDGSLESSFGTETGAS